MFARERVLRPKARLHKRFLSRQLSAIFVGLKLQLQNRTCKSGAIFSAICRRDIARVSNMFEIFFGATRIASSCRDKNRQCKRALKFIFAVSNTCLFFFSVVLFILAGFYQMSVWAIGKHRNYRKEFKDYPKGRKAIVPFLL